MHFGGATPEDEAHAIMDKALEMGINFFDTANVGLLNTGLSKATVYRYLDDDSARVSLAIINK